MQRAAFKMHLIPGHQSEYQRRHDQIWPELKALLTEAGVRNYSIFLDPESNILFGYLELTDTNSMDNVPHEPLMRRWWDYMSDIMLTDDGMPVTTMLPEMFHMT
jgi:L-rhamnose mutarotase